MQNNNSRFIRAVPKYDMLRVIIAQLLEFRYSNNYGHNTNNGFGGEASEALPHLIFLKTIFVLYIRIRHSCNIITGIHI